MRSLQAKDVLVPSEENESDVGGSLNEGGFVGRLRLVSDEAIFLGGEHSVAESEVAEKGVEVHSLG